ncbi:MAG: cell division protein FtsQ [Nocardioides sp.]|nr:cell division protein FtsQ [Nocardioides sp.]
MRNPVRRGDSGTATVPPVEQTTARSRRRFARRQWARRWLAWKYVVAAVLLVALVAGTVWAVFFSSFLAVQGVRVVGLQDLRASQIRDAAAVPEGEPLARLDLDGIRRRVESLAGVRSADVTREWPDHVQITVVERVAVAVVEIGGRIRGMDAYGVVFRDYQQAPPGLPHVQTSTETRSDALEEAAKVIAALPADLARIVDHVEVQTVDQIELVLRDGRVVVWGSAEESGEKARVLAALLHRPARTYDVSVPGQPTTAGTP